MTDSIERAFRLAHRMANGGDVPDDADAPIDSTASIAAGHIVRARPPSAPEYSDEALRLFGRRADTGREPSVPPLFGRWEPPSRSKYYEAARDVDTGPAPLDREKMAQIPGLWGRALKQDIIDPVVNPFVQAHNMFRDQTSLIDPATGHPTPEAIEMSTGIAGNLLGAGSMFAEPGALGLTGGRLTAAQRRARALRATRQIAEEAEALPPPPMGHNEPPPEAALPPPPPEPAQQAGPPLRPGIDPPPPEKQPGRDGRLNPMPVPPNLNARLNRMDKRRDKPETGEPNSDAIELPNGVHIGNVNLDQWINRTESVLKPDEIAAARNWYHEALPVYEQYFGPERGAAMLGAWLTANVNATPSFAQLSAIRTLEQYLNKTGDFATNKKGGLADEKLKQYWDAILSGDLAKLGQGGSGQKIYDFVDASLLKDTRTFYGDHPMAGAPAVADVHSLRDMGFIDKRTLNWINEQDWTKAQKNKVLKQITRDAANLSPGEAQYEWAANKMRSFAQQLNERGYMGGNWTPLELQAVGWTSMSKLFGAPAETSTLAIEKNIRNLSYELDFGAGAPYHDQFPGWAGLSGDQKVAVSKSILPDIVDFAKSVAGAHEFQRIQGLGGWHEFINPAYKSRLIASPEVAGDVADMIGYLAQQTEVFGYRPQDSGKTLGVALHGGGLKDPSNVAKLWSALVERHPEFAAGFSPSIRAQDGMRGMEILLDKGGERMLARVQQEMVPALEKLAGELGIGDLDMALFRAEKASRANDWTKDPGGSGYLQRLVARYGPDVQSRLELFKREKLEPKLRAEIDRHGGGGGGAAAASEVKTVPGAEGLPHAQIDPNQPTYLRVGRWDPKSARSHNYAQGDIEAGLSAYDLDKQNRPVTPSEGEWAADDLRDRLRGDEPKLLVQGDLVGQGHDGEPLLANVRVVGLWRPQNPKKATGGAVDYAAGGAVHMADGGPPTAPAGPDLSTFSDAQLQALEKGDMSGLSDAQLHVLEGKSFALPGPSQAPPNRLGGFGDLAKGVGRGLVGFAGNVVDAVTPPPFDTASRSISAMRNAPEPTAADLERHGSRANYFRAIGQTVPSMEENFQRAVGLHNDKPSTVTGTAGETVGNPMSWFGPGGPLAKLAMGTVSGAGSEFAGQMAEGSGYELPARVAGAVASGPLAARAVKPQLAPAQRMLAEQGVRLTPGQAFPGPAHIAKGAEDVFTSIPILGSFIKGARGRSVESFNRAVADQALEPIGESLNRRTPVGRQLATEVDRKVGEAYDRLLPTLNFVPDRQFALDLNAIHTGPITRMPVATQEQFGRIVDSLLPHNAQLDGHMFKDIESEINKIAKSHLASPMASERQLGDALNQVLAAMRAGLERSNPGSAEQLRNINLAYAMSERLGEASVRRAASSGSEAGVFMPSDLLQAIKNSPYAPRKAFRRGDGLMQAFAEAGQRVLPSQMPSSGTSERAVLMAATTGTLPFLPKTAAGIAAGSALYTRPSIAAFNRWISPTQGRARSAYRNAASGVIPPLRSAIATPNPYAPDEP